MPHPGMWRTDDERLLLRAKLRDKLRDGIDTRIDRLDVGNGLRECAFPNRLCLDGLCLHATQLQHELGVLQTEQGGPLPHGATTFHKHLRESSGNTRAHRRALHRFDNARRAEVIRYRHRKQNGGNSAAYARRNDQCTPPLASQTRTGGKVMHPAPDRHQNPADGSHRGEREPEK